MGGCPRASVSAHTLEGSGGAPPQLEPHTYGTTRGCGPSPRNDLYIPCIARVRQICQLITPGSSRPGCGWSCACATAGNPWQPLEETADCHRRRNETPASHVEPTQVTSSHMHRYRASSRCQVHQRRQEGRALQASDPAHRPALRPALGRGRAKGPSRAKLLQPTAHRAARAQGGHDETGSDAG